MERGYRYINRVSLNKEHKDLLVNFIDYWEEHPNGKTFQYACVTDLPLTADNATEIVRAGRSRWKVENETFNTLKNQGYRLEHNYGHGVKHLSSVFGVLTMLAFFLDQIVEANCRYFQAARGRCHSKTFYWEVVRGLFRAFVIPDWEHLYGAVIWGHDGELKINWNDSG